MRPTKTTVSQVFRTGMPGTRVYTWGSPVTIAASPHSTSLCLRRDCLRLRADSSLPMANQMELSMVKAFCCRYCRVEIEPIGLADGSAALVCIDCDLIGIEIGRAPRLNSSHITISYAVFCLKKKKKNPVQKDVHTQAAEEKLRIVLGTRV